MQDSEDTYRHRLQRDVPTGMAAFLCFLVLLLPMIGIVSLLVKGPQIDARGHPLYWLILGLPALWAWRMMDYAPFVLLTIRPFLFGAPFGAALVLVVASFSGREMTAYWIMLLLTAGLSTAGGIIYNRSLLAREGAGD